MIYIYYVNKMLKLNEYSKINREKNKMLKLKHDRFFVATTRFNNDTFRQNMHYREKHKIDGCVYGLPKEMPKSIPLMAKVFILEMNNEKSKIEGIGYLYNKPYTKGRLNIYQDKNYNRYSYLGKHRVDRYQLNERQLHHLSLLENMVFRGKDHIKRGEGVTSIPQKKLETQKRFILKFLIDIFIGS